jgi:hypothetical protein
MTQFKGKKTGFNPSGSNDTTPNRMGPPATKFMGRGGVPEGPLKRFPGITEDVEGGNRRLARAKHGDGGGSGTSFSTTGGNAFGKGRK